jgi:hypothetical protein
MDLIRGQAHNHPYFSTRGSSYFGDQSGPRDRGHDQRPVLERGRYQVRKTEAGSSLAMRRMAKAAPAKAISIVMTKNPILISGL